MTVARYVLAFAACCLTSILPVVAPSRAADSVATPPLQFVKLYIEQLGTIEKIRDNGAHDLNNNASQQMANCVHTMTQYQLELSSQISMMQSMHLKKELEFLPPGLADFYTQKRALYKQMGDGCATMMEGPKPNVDYGKLAANMPKVNAQIEYIDEGVFKATPAVFASLINTEKTNSQNGCDHLLITKAERAALIRRINDIFGEKLTQANQNYIVSSASVLASYLEKKGYKGADEPWD